MSATKDKKESKAEEPETQEESADEKVEREWNERMDELRRQQGLGPDATPENRDIRYEGTPESAIVKKLREAGDPRGGQVPAHGFEEYKRAASKEQKAKAEKESAGNHRFFAGQRGWVNNPGEPDHGRAVGVLRVSEFQSEMDEVLDSVQGGRGKAKTYECESRDGRAEKLFISAEHFRPCFNEAEWGKTPIMTPIPDGS